jgi:hypothetical protein
MPKQHEIAETSLTRDVLHAARYYLGGRRGLIALAVVAVFGGLALNWSWLVAAGIAPVLLTALPCAAMCALGLCAGKMGGKSCAADPAVRRAAAETDASRYPPVEPAPVDEEPTKQIVRRTPQEPSMIGAAEGNETLGSRRTTDA